MSALELDSLKTELLRAIAEAARPRQARGGARRRARQEGPHLRADAGARLAAAGRAQELTARSVNSLKTAVGEALEARRAELVQGARPSRSSRSSAPTSRCPVRAGPLAEGRIHPVSQVTDEITEIFADMGFSIAEGPDIETDFNNFTALNIPPEHPARQDHDTFYFPEAPDGIARRCCARIPARCRSGPCCKQKPPLRIIAPGRVYRCDSDQTHTPMFHQVEGLVIDEATHLGHLKWVLEEFCKAFFEVPQVKMRFRASHFPFTEPSMEVDIGYAKVGDEIRIGEGDQWLEILGCGMVHPNVLKNVGLDPERYQGFAFGMGIDRIAMLKYGMPDLRAFFAGDLRWLKHYGFPPLAIPTLAGGLS